MNWFCIFDGDIQYALLEAPMIEKRLFFDGDKWIDNKDRVDVVIHTLYELKSNTRKFSNHIAEILGNKLGFKSSLANPYLWYKASNSRDGFRYYS